MAALFIFCAVFLATSGCHAAKLISDIVYRTRSDQQLRLDIYTPDVTTVSCPMVLMFHGGGWTEGDKIYHGYIGPVLADMGIIAISANYRLAPVYKYPDCVTDCQAALKWIRKNGAIYGGDPTRIALLGESAGGHLASLVGLIDSRGAGAGKNKKAPAVRGVVDIVGPSDLTVFYEHLPVRALLFQWFGFSPYTKPRPYRSASPMTYVNSNSCPFVIIHGTLDSVVPVAHAQNLHNALVSAGVSSQLVLLVGADHGWAPDSQHAIDAMTATVNFLKARLLD